jgi:hypothetical protein
MNRERTLKLIQESLELAKTAPLEHKIRLLKMVRECYARINQSKSRVIISESPTSSDNTTDPDYIEEK